MYKKLRHSCYDLNYHLVLVIKYRHKVIEGSLSEDLKEYIFSYFKNNKIIIQEYNDDLDHIHILFEGKPNLNLSHFINGLKTNSSKVIRQKHSEKLSEFYWKPYFWSNSYFIGCVSERSENSPPTELKHRRGTLFTNLIDKIDNQ